MTKWTEFKYTSSPSQSKALQVWVVSLVKICFTQVHIYSLSQSRVLWLAGSSSWSSPHKKVRRRVTSFWSSGHGIGWERSRRGVSLGRINGGWSRKLSKMSENGNRNNETCCADCSLDLSTVHMLPPLRSVPGGGAQDAGGARVGPSL